MYDMADLMGVKIRGDNLENFLNTWDMVMPGMRSEVTEECMRVLCLENIRKCGFLRVELAHVDRFEISHPQRNYNWLMDMCRKYLERQRLELNRLATRRALAGDMGKPAIPAEDEKLKKKKLQQQ